MKHLVERKAETKQEAYQHGHSDGYHLGFSAGRRLERQALKEILINGSWVSLTAWRTVISDLASRSKSIGRKL